MGFVLWCPRGIVKSRDKMSSEERMNGLLSFRRSSMHDICLFFFFSSSLLFPFLLSLSLSIINPYQSNSSVLCNPFALFITISSRVRRQSLEIFKNHWKRKMPYVDFLRRKQIVSRTTRQSRKIDESLTRDKKKGREEGAKNI